MSAPALFKTFAGLLALYGAVCGLLFLGQRRIIFPRHFIPDVPAEKVPPAGVERLWIKTPHATVEAWLLPPDRTPPSGRYPAAIFAHGNAELIDFWLPELRSLTRLGVGVLLVEYPGYGRSTGNPSMDSITQTFAAAYDTLVARRQVDASKIVLIGRSLGGAAACALAGSRPSAAMILMSTFTSVRDMAPFWVPGFLIRDPFDNLAVVRSYRKPVFIIHGRQDRTIPYDHAIELHRTAPQSTLLGVNAGHNDCPPDWAVFWRAVADFLQRAGLIDPGADD
jgi:pimeloyl-ACP methyl ester carboxylesterase